MARSKNPRVRNSPARGKQVRTASRDSSDSCSRKTIIWNLGFIDLDGPWGLEAMKGDDDWNGILLNWNEILRKLRGFELMTWEEVMQASGGRGERQ